MTVQEEEHPNAFPGGGSLRDFMHSERFKPFLLSARTAFYRFAGRHYHWSFREDVEDAWQAAVVDVFLDKPDNFKNPSEMAGAPEQFEAVLTRYLGKAAINKLSTRLASLGKSAQRFQSLDGMVADGVDFDKLLYEGGHTAPGAEADAEATGMKRLLDACLAKLSALARETFKLALQGYTDTEIQALTRTGSANAIRRRVSETKSTVVECVRRKSGGKHD